MEPTYIYPGTFCPPHYGHIAIAKEAAAVFEKITVICSVNPVKEGKMPFDPDECKEMWKSYGLGKNIEVATLDEFLATRNNSATTIMIRGIRNDNDIKYENSVILYNCKNYGVRHYHYILSKKEFENMSSAKARLAAKSGDPKELEKMVNRGIASKMMKKFHPEN
ncbi:MAG: adenylyltransferase/cytidyltransferase family protein [Minisyncoccales bacterium]